MTYGQKLLLETLAGHFAWLETAHPSKAKKPCAKKAKQYVQMTLRACNRTKRLAA